MECGMAEGLLGGAVGDEDEKAEAVDAPTDAKAFASAAAAEPPCGPRGLRVRS
jgi:hypothetical protein